MHKKGKYTNSNKLNITFTQSAPNNLYSTKNNSNLFNSYSVEPLSVLNHSYYVESYIYHHVENKSVRKNTCNKVLYGEIYWYLPRVINPAFAGMKLWQISENHDFNDYELSSF